MMQWWEMSGPGGRTICLSGVRVVQSNYPEGTTQISDRQTAKWTRLIARSCSRRIKVTLRAEWEVHLPQIEPN